MNSGRDLESPGISKIDHITGNSLIKHSPMIHSHNITSGPSTAINLIF